MAFWADLYRLFTYAFTDDPLAKQNSKRRLSGAGVSQPDAIPDLRNADGFTAGAGAFIRVQNDLIDVTSIGNRLNRYKEYDRLLASMPEIDMSMTVFADETCFTEDTKIATVFYGFKTIKWLYENQKENRFPVYCYSFEKEDYTIGWAYDPRPVKKAKVIKLLLSDGNYETVTLDHKILKRNGTWVEAENLKVGDELMPFYRLRPNRNFNDLKTNQYPRIYTHNKGWIHERQFIDEWRQNCDLEEYKECNTIVRMKTKGMLTKDIQKFFNKSRISLESTYLKHGFTTSEIKQLSKIPDKKRIIGIQPVKEEQLVYDLSVETHQNFCTESIVLHNCQRDENNRVFKINVKNQAVKKELELLFFGRNELNLNQRSMWNKAKRLFVMGDLFLELIIDPEDPKKGIQGIQELPADSMYRIETTKGKLLEFQQAKEGPDFQAIVNAPIASATEAELAQSYAIRFSPEQIIHIRIGDYRKPFYPYGVSLIDPARGAAHQLRMMEDSMVVYRLCLVGNTRVRTTKGYKYIKDLEHKDLVYSFDKDKVVPAEVLYKKDNGIQSVFTVKSQHIEITGTATHPILVNRDGIIQYVDIQDLNTSKDKLILVSQNNNEEKEINIPHSKYTRFPEKVNNNFAKLLGSICIASEINEENKIVLKTKSSFYKKYIKQILPKSLKSEMNFSYFNDLFEGNINRVPNWMFNCNLEIRKSFMEGILNKKQFIEDTSYTIKSNNEQFLEDIKELWTGMGLCSGHIKHRKKENIWTIRLTYRKLPKYEDIVKVIKKKKERVYDISVNNTIHNFIANGVPVHNTRAPERRIFYIDVGQLPSYKAEAFVERLKDQFKKKKVVRNPQGATSANSVEERYHAPAQDEDYWLPLRPGSNTRIETLPGACLALDTKIPLLDGRTLSLSDLIKEYEEGKQNWAYSCNPQTGKPIPGKITWAGITRKNTEVMRITFDNGESLVCTPDHKFPLIGRKEKTQAKDLKPGDSMIPFNLRMKPLKTLCNTQHLQIYDISTKKWKSISELRKQLNGSIKGQKGNDSNRKKLYNKMTIVFPKIVFDKFMEYLKQGLSGPKAIEEINKDKNLVNILAETNKNISRKSCIHDGLKRTHISRMVQAFGYKNISHAIEEAECYNHKVVKVEFLTERVDTGTLTIDGHEELHNYHTFAISLNDNGITGIYTYNSNLDAIDDSVYFRSKLFAALGMPRNYFSLEDPSQTRISLSALDARFARLIERLQSYLEDGLCTIADRHLKLIGVPEEAYEDLDIKMTPPSDWRELSRAEVMTNRISNANSLAGSLIYSQKDILTKIMHHSDEEADEIIARVKIQKMEDLKLQILGQNPILLGVGLPGSDETEIGTEPGGPNPQLGDQSMSPDQGFPPPEMAAKQEEENELLPPSGQAKPLADPTDDEIINYDLSIEDYSNDKDIESIDYSEIE